MITIQSIHHTRIAFRPTEQIYISDKTPILHIKPHFEPTSDRFLKIKVGCVTMFHYIYILNKYSCYDVYYPPSLRRRLSE